MIKRRDPDPLFRGVPCSMVAVGTATGAMPKRPDGMKRDGYLSLYNMNRFVRSQLVVLRMVQFQRDCRPTLKEFLDGNTRRAVICVRGHFVYADGSTYWSFQKNAKDPVVAVWYIRQS